MKQATVTLNIAQHGHHVTRTEVTPAELLLLVAEHHRNAGGDPVVELQETGEVTRTADQEVSRLRQRYLGAKIDALFQGAIPNMPESFEQARSVGIGAALPGTKLTEPKPKK